MTPQEEPAEQYHFSPATYKEMIQDAIPRYEELQRETVEAVPFEPRRVLELGIGTGVTTRALLERFPEAEVTGLDSTPEMVFRARELGIEVRLARMEDPLPDGPWDLVISALAIHHLQADGKRDLFRRVREQSRALVFGDVVEVDARPPHRADRRPTGTIPPRQPTRPSGGAVRSCGRPTTWRSSGPSTMSGSRCPSRLRRALPRARRGGRGHAGRRRGTSAG